MRIYSDKVSSAAFWQFVLLAKAERFAVVISTCFCACGKCSVNNSSDDIFYMIRLAMHSIGIVVSFDACVLILDCLLALAWRA